MIIPIIPILPSSQIAVTSILGLLAALVGVGVAFLIVLGIIKLYEK